MKISIDSAGGVASKVRLGPHELTFDQPGAVPGGQDRGPSPLDVMAGAIGACAHYYAAAFLFARGLATNELKVEVEFEKTREPVPRLGHFSIHVILPSGVPARHALGVERAVRHCPAYGTLTHPPDVLLTFDTQAHTSAPAA